MYLDNFVTGYRVNLATAEGNPQNIYGDPLPGEKPRDTDDAIVAPPAGGTPTPTPTPTLDAQRHADGNRDGDPRPSTPTSTRTPDPNATPTETPTPTATRP